MKSGRVVGYAILLGVVSAFVALCMIASPDGGRAFDVQEWAAGAPGEPNFGTRHYMVPDLLARHLKLGMSRSEVVALLGPPDYEKTSEAGVLSMWKVTVSGYMSDTASLVVEWGAEETVVRVSY